MRRAGRSQHAQKLYLEKNGRISEQQRNRGSVIHVLRFLFVLNYLTGGNGWSRQRALYESKAIRRNQN